MSYVVKNQNSILSDERKLLAKKLGISEEFMRLLLGRGIADGDIYDYLHPSVNNFSSPYDIDGMKEAVERIQRAIDLGERILIYGDYDCDGICAVSTLALYLRDKTAVSYFIPSRSKDGYGLSVGAIDRLIEDENPNLVITVDCGITAVKEVEYLKSRGIDVIVTDHHEPQEQIPSCTVLDAKIARNGFCDYCGAGVALKLVEALAGRDEACKYLDITAIATLADVVPLKGDNRIIAKLGLDMIKDSPRTGIKLLLGEDEPTSQNVAFRLAPRMNAAGRLNSAMKVVELFLQDDYFMLKTLAEELKRDNARRQELCEDLVKEAKEMLRGEDFARLGLIALCGDGWEAGVLGIAASKLVEEFKRPAVLFTKNGDTLKGSARSIPSINIFELFSILNGYFTSFGGHSQAAGVSIKPEDFEAFKKAANEIIFSRFAADEFIPDEVCEMQLPLDFDFLGFAEEIKKMEPFGYENPRPDFLVSVEGHKFEKIGFSKHVKCKTDNLDLLAFFDYSDSLTANRGREDLQINLDINCFRNNVSAQGIVRGVDFKTVDICDDEAVNLNLHHFDCENGAYVSKLDISDAENEIESSPFGTIAVCFSAKDYDDLCKKSKIIVELPVSVGRNCELNPKNCVVICPNADFDFSYYRTAVIAGAPLYDGYIGKIASEAQRVFAVCDASPQAIDFSDDDLRAIYKAIVRTAQARTRLGDMRALYALVNAIYPVRESLFMLAIKIFNQLGLVRIADRGYLEISRKPTALDNSPVYRRAKSVRID